MGSRFHAPVRLPLSALGPCEDFETPLTHQRGYVLDRAIIEFYEYKCAFCGEPFQEQGHGKALAHGGEHSAANVFPLCHACNQSQGTHTRFPERRHPWMVGTTETPTLSCEKWNA